MRGTMTLMDFNGQQPARLLQGSDGVGSPIPKALGLLSQSKRTTTGWEPSATDRVTPGRSKQETK